MHLKNSDVFVALSIVLLNVVELLLPSTILWMSVLLALPLVFFVPGYMLTAVLTHTRQLDVFHRLTFSLGVSLTLDILGGFLLNVLPIGLRTQSWVMLLSCLTLLFALAVLYLRRDMVYVSGREDYRSASESRNQRTPWKNQRTPTRGVPTIHDVRSTQAVYSRDAPCGRPSQTHPSQTHPSQTHPLRVFKGFWSPLHTTRSIFWTRVRDGLVFALTATLVILSLVYATRGVAEGPHVGFTQLWILPPSRITQRCTTNIGIRSFENGSVSYHAIMTMNGTQTMSWPKLVIAPNQLWERSIVVTPIKAKNIFVQVKLYKNDKPTVVYREVHMTLTILMSGQKIVSCG